MKIMRMRDYEKILSDLRLKSLLVQSGMADPLYLDAADAIEELLVKAGLWHRRYQLEHEKVEKLRSAAPHWISVEERLPKKDETVIVYYSWIGQSGTEYKEVSLATLEEMRYCGNKLLGWMPLPEPPKGVE